MELDPPVSRAGSSAVSMAVARTALVWYGTAGLYDRYGSAAGSAGAARGTYKEASSAMRAVARPSLSSVLHVGHPAFQPHRQGAKAV